MPITRSQRGTSPPNQSTAPRATESAQGTTDSSGTSGTATEGTLTTYESRVTSGTLATAPGVPAAPTAATAGTRKTRSVKSTRRREMEAKLELARRQLEEAKAAAELAKAQWELIQVENEESEVEDEDWLHNANIHTWVQSTVERMSGEGHQGEVSGEGHRLGASGEGRAGQPPVTIVKPEDQAEPSSNGTKELAEAIMKAISVAPRNTSQPNYVHELPDFDGRSEEWIAFRTVYEDTAPLFTDVQNMARLRRSIKGTAREAIKSLLYSECPPEEVIEALRRRFGRPEALILMELEKVKNLPRINENARDICVFASRVNNTVATIRGLRRPQYLHSPEMVRIIVSKMPAVLQYRWYDFAADAEDQDPDLVHLMKFLNREADRCGPYATQETTQQPRQPPRRQFTNTTSEQIEEKKTCPHCQYEHHLFECRKFLQLPMKERWDVATKSKMCFKCLQGRHRKETCRRPPSKTCKRWHHFVLHEERWDHPKPEEKKEIANNVMLPVNTARTAKAYLKMVPVELYGPKGAARILALLDEGSTVTLLDSAVARQIGLKGPVEALTLETVGGKTISKQDSMKVNVRLKGMHQTKKRTISGARAIDDINLTPQRLEIRRIEECAHLKPISKQLYYEEESPKLLIGQDNWELIVSRATRKGKRSQPVASLTYLGWVLHGSDGAASRPVNFVTCAHVFSKEEDLEKIIKEHFAVESLGIQPRRPTTDIEERALAILEETTKRLDNGRFETDLLWRNKEGKMPDNYKQAENRLRNIEKKLDRDPALKQVYESRVKNLDSNDATRDVPKDFGSGHRWFNGPSFLAQEEEYWPESRTVKAEHTGEEKERSTVGATKPVDRHPTPNPVKFSSWTRLVRATARVLQFVDLCRKKKHAVNVSRKSERQYPTWKRNKKKAKVAMKPVNKNTQERRFIPLEPDQIREAEKILLRRSQEESFQDEVRCVKKMKPFEKNSRLKKLDVVMEDGLLRLRGRIDAARHTRQDKKPVVLDSKHHITRLLIAYYHEEFNHGNHATVINELRQRYWILGLRSAVRATVHRCQWCKVYRGTPRLQPMGNLPLERLRHGEPPFTCTAVDYFGPMSITVGRRREKRWGVLFTCLTTRAVHVELAASLSTDSMILALRRMAARRGMPKTIFSDNGTNFVGANKELQEALASLNKEDLITTAERMSIRWKFIPPGAPNMGGAWERLVRSIKTALAVTLKERHPKEEVLHTLLLEAEHLVNSRPLIEADEDNEEGALTPNHFLIGRSCGTRLGTFTDEDLTGRRTWRTAQRLADHFWSRWVKEYLPTLIPRRVDARAATRDLQSGDTVLIVDSTLPRGAWPRGEVVRTFPGPDGRTRVLEVRTTGGVLRRPSSKLVLLVPARQVDVDDEKVDDTGGGASTSEPDCGEAVVTSSHEHGVAGPGVGATHEGEDVGD
ncbi:uncharacterized protein [Epargyreus clarus]|uniref:uncharacterized protein n=1 Tax=Epargyreus clarus TaxID=520877 RepID=UPI003C2CEF96